MKYHPLGVPADVPRSGEEYLGHLKMLGNDHRNNSSRIQWMGYQADGIFHPVVKSRTHIAFEVEDLEKPISGHEIPIEPNCP